MLDNLEDTYMHIFYIAAKFLYVGHGDILLIITIEIEIVPRVQ